MPWVYLSLGSNQGDTRSHLEYAIAEVRNRVGFVTKVSSFYRTEPIGVLDQPDFLNAVLKCQTNLEPAQLLVTTGSIERDRGRVRSFPGAPRTLDIDILLYDNLILESETLTIPHPRLTERSFVLTPLFEIEPDLRLPDGASLGDLIVRPCIARQRVVNVGEPSNVVGPTYL